MKTIRTLLLLIISLNTKAQIPALDWANTTGGSDGDKVYSIVTDNVGSVYTTGYFQDTADFDPGSGVLTMVGYYGNSVFVTKYNSSGNFSWAISIPQCSGFSITADADCNVYVIGNFHDSADFDPGIGLHMLYSTGARDIFILKLDSSGNFIWANSFGGNSDDNGFSICLENSNSICITGEFRDTVDFDPSVSNDILISDASADDFIGRYDLSGNLIWVKRIGGTGYDDGASITSDSDGNIISVGGFDGTTDFDPGVGSFLLSATGWDIFISKLDSNGNFVWAKHFSGGVYSNVNDVIVDASKNVYVTGSFQNTYDFDPGAGVANLISNGSDDLFLCKLSSTGNFIWVKQIGGANQESGTSFVIDQSQRLFMTGYFWGTVDFDPGSGADSLISSGNFDFFISTFDLNGNSLLSFNIGGTGNDEAWNIACDNTGNIFLGGYFYNTVDFDATASSDIHSSIGNDDFFVMKFNPGSVGMQDLKINSDIFIYPNPVSDYLTIQSKSIYKNCKLEITNTIGEKIISQEINSVKTNINIQALPSGVYFTSVTMESGKTWNQKFIKQ